MSARAITMLLSAMLVVAACGTANQPAAPAAPGAPAVADPSAAPVDLGPTRSDEQVAFNVSLRLPGQADLDSYLAGLSQPGSASYRQFLSAAQFGARFGLPDAAVAQVVAWLNAGGLSAQATPQKTSIAVSGTAAQVDSLLGVNLVDRLSASGVRYHMPLGTPTVPAALNDDVAVVVGLDTEPVQQSAWPGIYLSGVPDPGLTPSVIASAYEISPLHDAGYFGDGQTIAIVSFDTFTASDVATFDRQMGISGAPAVKKVTLAGGPDAPGAGAGEVSLDIEVTRGIAPHAQIISYEGANTADGLVAIVSRIVADGKAKIISNSWGTCEIRNSKAAMAAEERELAAAVAAGVTVFASSGDAAAYDCRREKISSDPFDRDVSPGVDWPAASANVVAVGGTYLTVHQDGAYLDEAGWEEPLSGAGSGGGLSQYQPRPSWQQGAGVDNAQSTGMRQVPDVAGPADPSSGFFIIYTDPGQGLVNGRVGGTSAAAPFWASSMLLAEQLAAAQGISNVGPLGPTLYQVAAAAPSGALFHDVIKGGNLLYDATPGWDYATGLGSPRVAPLAAAIVDFLKR
ncbi:MAG TPA: S53 family peptidase [Candidatus Limnocylindrales bacterium]